MLLPLLAKLWAHKVCLKANNNGMRTVLPPGLTDLKNRSVSDVLETSVFFYGTRGTKTPRDLEQMSHLNGYVPRCTSSDLSARRLRLVTSIMFSTCKVHCDYDIRINCIYIDRDTKIVHASTCHPPTTSTGCTIPTRLDCTIRDVDCMHWVIVPISRIPANYCRIKTYWCTGVSYNTDPRTEVCALS
jgi:hypothetical protein